ncbi:hypothetical protein Clacol_009291 [Clathrus columnatus]|uniref:non-specific serine/threonine protein kinase n=1 Tax=Clathrus columnatus TaxID=1419009 RepID=A0AAV5ANE2_9AGAM|nr:hypothetical protein Clacol_009291 [Clathrus columnatus]
MSSLRSIPVQNQVPVTQLYRKLEIVGKGAYGAVYRGIHIPTGDIVALKIINLDTPDDDVEDIQREVALLSQLRGPGTNNVTKYYGCYLDGPHVWIVMDYASGGSVRTLMKATKGNVIEERYSVIIIRELLGALVYIHKSGVIHRDIKAANVLVTDQGRVILCDFGVSALLSTAHSKRTTFVGTPYWMAPEVITSGSMYDSKADIWSLGITLYEMIIGAPPHSNQVEMKVLSLIPSTKPPRLAEHDGSKDMRDFLAMCLKEVPGERANAEDLTKARWIKVATKTPVSILRELIIQYDAWSRAGGVRQSLVAEDEDDDDSLKSNRRESTWEFNTLRGGSLSSVDPSALTSNNSTNDQNGNTHTSTDPIPKRMPPRSLRMLFEGAEGSAGNSDPFGMITRSRTTTPAPPPSLPPLPLSGRQSPIDNSRDADKTVKKTGVAVSITPPSVKTQQPPTFPHIEPSSPQSSNGSRSSSRSSPNRSTSPTSSAHGSDPTTARQATFAFPPLPPVPPMSVSTSTSSLSQQLSPQNTSIVSSSDDESISTRPRSSTRTATYREVRQNRGLPDISIPPNTNKSKTPSTSPSSPSPPVGGIPPFPAVSAVRNDSIASGSSTSTIRRVRKVATASPVNFQFPASSRPRVGSQPEQFTSTAVTTSLTLSSSPPNTQTVPMNEETGKTSPTLLRTTSPTSSPTHQTTHSLDDSIINSPGSIHRTGLTMPLPPFSRAHSATPAGRRSTSAKHGAALSRGPSLNRQGSVAVMETVPTTPIAPPPLRVPKSENASTSGYRSEGETGGMKVPTLKDVLKLSPLPMDSIGNPDLLPPSPSIHAPLTRLPSRPHQPPIPLHVVTTTSTTPFDQNTPSDGPSAAEILKPPVLRPLDLLAFAASPAETHAELARTVDDLAKWLSFVENGLTDLLERSLSEGGGQTVIKENFEEEEDGDDLDVGSDISLQ